MKTCKKQLHQYEGKFCPICKQLWRINNREQKAAYEKIRYKENKEQVLTYMKEYYKENKEQRIAYQNTYYKENREQVITYRKIYYKENKEQRTTYQNTYYKENREQRIAYHAVYSANRRMNDHLFKLRGNISHLISLSYKNQGYNKNTKTEAIIGCSFEHFNSHLISTAIANYGSYIDLPGIYHIDHIIPMSSAKCEKEVLKLNHYSNLQLLYPKDNIKKSNKLDWSLNGKT